MKSSLVASLKDSVVWRQSQRGVFAFSAWSVGFYSVECFVLLRGGGFRNPVQRYGGGIAVYEFLSNFFYFFSFFIFHLFRL